MPSKKKNSKANTPGMSSFVDKYKLILVGFVGLVIGAAGTATLQSSSAFYRNTINVFVPNGSSMGASAEVTAYYNNKYKNPSVVANCWHVSPTPAGWPDSIGSASNAQINAWMSGMPVFTKTLNPLPASGVGQYITVGTVGSGPAICKFQLMDSGKEVSWNIFGMN